MLSRIQRLSYSLLSNRRGWFHLNDGSKVFFPPRSYCAACILHSGVYEREITELLKCAAVNGTTVFDIGANIGLSALPLLAEFDELRVISAEVSPSVLPFLYRTHKASPYSNRWEVVAKAMTANVGGTVSFTVHDSGGDVFDGIYDTGRADGAKVLEVAKTSVDAEWQARGTPEVSLIKVDVEGGELDVIKGAAGCLRHCHPVVVTEWSPKNFSAYGSRATAILDLASELDYKVFVVPTLSPAERGKVFEAQLAVHENLILFPK